MRFQGITRGRVLGVLTMVASLAPVSAVAQPSSSAGTPAAPVGVNPTGAENFILIVEHPTNAIR